MEAFIEAVTPDTREQLNRVLDALREDREKSRRMLPDGSYVRDEGGEGTSSQEALYRYFSARRVSVNEPEEAGTPESEKEEPAGKPRRGFRGWLRHVFINE